MCVCVWLCYMFEILPSISWVIMQFPEKAVQDTTVSGVALSIGFGVQQPGLCTLKYLPCASCFSSMKCRIESTFSYRELGGLKGCTVEPSA